MPNTKTLIKQPTAKTVKPKNSGTLRQPANPLIKKGEFKRIPLSELDASPLNYRKFFPKTQLEELAADIALHGIISNLTVRPMPSGRYEIVAEERRFRAASMIGVKELPANIVSLTDQEVKEIQLSENGQRENPHPMQEAIRAADVQAAIKTGTVTVEQLQGEINRINTRETRSQKLDREKVQIIVHDKFESNLNTLLPELTAADLVAVRLILFQSLNYSARNNVLQTFFIENEKFDHKNNGELYRQLENLNATQVAYLIRMAVASNAESKNPNAECGYFLYKMAAQAGLDIVTIEKMQKEKADGRQVKQQERIVGLQKQIERIQHKEYMNK